MCMEDLRGLTFDLLHTNRDMTFEDAPKSTKQLCTL
jgi:hypothetical protein